MKKLAYSLIWVGLVAASAAAQTLNLDCTGGKVRVSGTSSASYAQVFISREADPFPKGELWAIAANGSERKFDLTLVWSGASGTYYVGLRPGNVVKSCTVGAGQTPPPVTPPPPVTTPPATPPPSTNFKALEPGTGLMLVEVPGQTTRIQVDSTVVLFVGSKTAEPCRRSAIAEDPATGQLYYCTAARKWRKLVME